MRVREMMSGPVVTVSTSTSIADAARVLITHGFTALPVLDGDDRLVGIVTEADLIRNRVPPDPRLHPGSRRADEVTAQTLTVGQVMTSPVESLTAGADVADAAQMMVDERIRCLPIVDGHGVVGILTRRDVLRAAIADNDQELADMVTRQLAALDNPDRWQVSVHAGVADIEDFGTDTTERAQASRLAAAVPGVVRVRARHQTPDPF
jgi:CBS-domain-containing membrane protein